MALKWGDWVGKKAPENGVEVPEALGDKSPEEIAAELTTLRQGASDAAALKSTSAEKDQQLSTANDELVKSQERIKALEAGTAPNPRNPPIQQITSVIEDEDKAFNERLAPVENSVMSVAGQTARMVAETKIQADPFRAGLLKDYQKEIDELYSGVPLQYRQFPQTFERVVSQVFGTHLQEITDKQNKANGVLFTEGSGGAPPPPPKDEKVAPLDADELEIARKMKISPEAMLASKRDMQMAGGHISFKRS